MMGRIIAQRPGAPAGKVDPCRKSRKVPLRSPYGEHYARGGYSCWNQAMDIVDALLFALLAAGDMALIVHLRKRRNRRLRLERMARCLAEAVRRDLRTPAPRLRARYPHPAANTELLPSVQ